MFCRFCSVCFHLSWCSVSGSTPQLDCHQSGTCPKALCWTLTRNWMQKSSFKILCPYRKWWFSKPSLFTGWHPVFLPKINIVLVSIHIWCDSPGKKMLISDISQYLALLSCLIHQNSSKKVTHAIPKMTQVIPIISSHQENSKVMLSCLSSGWWFKHIFKHISHWGSSSHSYDWKLRGKQNIPNIMAEHTLTRKPPTRSSFVIDPWYTH